MKEVGRCCLEMFTLECCHIVNENLHFKNGKYCSPVVCLVMVLVVSLQLKDFSRRNSTLGLASCVKSLTLRN